VRGGPLPPALLCAALAFALAFAPPRTRLPALIALCIVALVANYLPFHRISPEIVFAGCWVSVILTAASVFLRPGRPAWFGPLLGANAGLWSGAVIAISGTTLDLLRSLPAALILLPATWLVSRGGGIAVKVVSSWLVAIAILAATLPIVPTPGYAPDHME
jgi:hypothetical protein